MSSLKELLLECGLCDPHIEAIRAMNTDDTDDSPVACILCTEIAAALAREARREAVVQAAIAWVAPDSASEAANLLSLAVHALDAAPAGEAQP